MIPFGVDDRLAVTMYAFPPDRRARDLDNLFKLVFDAMQPLPIPDDSQIDVITMARGGVKPNGVLMVRIELTESYQPIYWIVQGFSRYTNFVMLNPDPDD